VATLKEWMEAQAWWYTPVIPVMKGVKVGRSWSEASSGKSERPYLKNKLKQKGLGVWPKWSLRAPV
jgi:hypothetical protein